MNKKCSTPKVLHGNNAKATSKVEPVYQTSTVVGKQTSNVHSNDPVNAVSDEDVRIAKRAVDDNHK